MQRLRYNEFAKAQGWTIKKEFFEKGVFGFKVSSENRDAIQKIKAAVAKKEFDVLFLYFDDPSLFQFVYTVALIGLVSCIPYHLERELLPQKSIICLKQLCFLSFDLSFYNALKILLDYLECSTILPRIFFSYY